MRQINLCFLSDAGSVHTQKWVRAFVGKGYKITVLSLRSAHIEGADVINLRPSRRLGKLGYLAVIGKVRSYVHSLQPDLLHAHYATSYGVLGALCRYRPFMISVWGSDVFDFPKKSFLHRALLKFNLNSADIIGSTSRIMATETALYTHRPIHITPFGVDTALFTPKKDTLPSVEKELTLGIVKKLEPKYGVHILLEVFIHLASRYPKARLLIVGSGSQENALRRRAEESGLNHRITFVPEQPHHMIPELLHKIDIFVAPSTLASESFGVAIVEASACGIPVVASRIGGLPEVIEDNKTGYLATPNNIDEFAQAISRLIESSSLRAEVGKNGRAFVLQKYAWHESVNIMEKLYKYLLVQYSDGKLSDKTPLSIQSIPSTKSQP
jgi:glycosyltransferase involved in cell wall biosynthesis